jgi:hypothetical protein
MQEVERLAKENNGKVPKEALLRYLAEDGAVRLEEVRMSDVAAQKEMRLKRFRDSQKVMREAGIFVDVSSTGEVLLRDKYSGPPNVDPKSLPENLQQQYEILRNNTADDRAAEKLEPKYGQYQLPGGENYREVVLAMPARDVFDPSKVKIIRSRESATQGSAQIVYNGEKLGPAYGDFGTVETNWQKPDSYWIDAARKLFNEGDKFNKVQRRSTDYASSHFPGTPNYVAHMRLNERADAKGKPGLFIEELQNDRANSWVAARDKWVKQNHSTKKFAEINGAEQEKAREFARSQVSVGPFTENQGAWISQLFKRALRDAVADGKDWIGWTTGETQATRFDLSKQIDRLTVTEDQNIIGSYRVQAFKDGGRVIDKPVKGEELPDVIGKDLAQRAIDNIQESRQRAKPDYSTTLTGLDLKVGGEDKINTYDRVAVNEVAKYVKQWGAQVEKSRMGKAPSKAFANAVAKFEEAKRKYGATSQQATEAMMAIPNESGGGGVAEYWRVNITPQMREGIKKAGQALFVGGAAAVVAEDQLEQ